MARLRRTFAAGQASVEYVAVIALVAALLLVAAPAAGAPDLAGRVAYAIRLGICVVASDVCSSREARADGLAPCPLRSDTNGAEAGVSVFSVDLGARGTLTVTPQSDGTVAAALAAGGGAGVSGGLGTDLGAGPLHAQVGAGAGAGGRVAAGRGWTFPDATSARRFLAGLPRSALHGPRWPPARGSVEGGVDAYARAGASLGRNAGAPAADGGDADSGDAGGARAEVLAGAVSAGATVGARRTRDGLTTLYLRANADAAVAVALFPDVGTGPVQFVAEYTSGPDGPRELAFRRAVPARRGNGVTETIARLDLRDPANWAVARPVVAGLRIADVDAVLQRIRVAGTTERYVSAVRDNTRGASASLKLGLKFGVSGTRIEIHRQLVDASARTAGSGERERFDCTGQLR